MRGIWHTYVATTPGIKGKRVEEDRRKWMDGISGNLWHGNARFKSSSQEQKEQAEGSGAALWRGDKRRWQLIIP